MNKPVKIKLKALESDQYDVEEMIIDKEGSILRVIPKHFNKEYRGLDLFIETCEPGEKPVILCALGMYYLKLPCIVTEVTPWTNEDYNSFETILFYPVTTTKDFMGYYMGEIYHKEYAISLNKEDLYPLYQKNSNIMGIEEHLRDESSNMISFPVRLYGESLKQILKSRKPVVNIMRKKIAEWKKIIPKAYFMIEYSKSF